MNECKAPPAPAGLRDERADTIRGIMMFLVVFSHFAQMSGDSICSNIYRVNYAFHMPVFLFLSGWYARFDAKKLLRRLVWPYIFFQCAYWCFQTYLLHNGFPLRFTTPYYSLWYLATLCTYHLLLPALDAVKSRGGALLLIGASYLLSLYIGFDDTVGEYLSLSRTIVFLPFFLLGHYHALVFDALAQAAAKRRLIAVLCVLLIFTGEYSLVAMQVPINALWFSLSYSAAGSFLIRLIAELTAFLWIILLMARVPDKSNYLAVIGRRTMPIYLLHGFAVFLAGHFALFRFGAVGNAFLAFGLAAVVTAVLGTGGLHKLFRRVF